MDSYAREQYPNIFKAIEFVKCFLEIKKGRLSNIVHWAESLSQQIPAWKWKLTSLYNFIVNSGNKFIVLMVSYSEPNVTPKMVGLFLHVWPKFSLND